MRRLVLATAVSLLLPASVAAQASQFGIRGLGQPGRFASVRALGSAGAFAPMDELSAINPASVGGLFVFTASFSGMQDFRSTTTSAGEGSIRESRFPLISIGGPLRRGKLSFGLSVANYLNRDYALASQDTLVLRGQPAEVFDTLISKGGVSDVQFAVAYRTGRTGAIGVGLHVLSGSNRNELRRTFTDTLFVSGAQRAELAYSAYGVSVGLLQEVTKGLSVAASARLDTRLEVDRDSTPAAEYRLPYLLNGGLRLRVSPKFDIAATGTLRNWSRTNADLVAQGAPGAADTYEGTFGFELHSERNAAVKPLRAGIRYATLPFFITPGAQANELGVAIGTGTRFGQGRAGIDLAVEYLQRKDGTGRRENTVAVSVGVSVRP